MSERNKNMFARLVFVSLLVASWGLTAPVGYAQKTKTKPFVLPPAVEKALEGLTDAEKKYAIEYIQTGGKPYVTHMDEVEPLSKLEKGQVVILGNTLEVKQVIDGKNMRVAVLGVIGRDQGDFWIEGIKTDDFSDGERIHVSKSVLVVAGTKRYDTAAGATRTVKLFTVLDTSNVDKAMAALKDEIAKAAKDAAAAKVDAAAERKRQELERIAVAKFAKAEKYVAAGDKAKAIKELKQLISDPDYANTSPIEDAKKLLAKLE